jgi:hypothetical protein
MLSTSGPRPSDQQNCHKEQEQTRDYQDRPPLRNEGAADSGDYRGSGERDPGSPSI